MTQAELEKILLVGVKLSAEQDLDRLLSQILDCVMELAHCDAGTLYLLEDEALHFRITRNHTLRVWENNPANIPPVPLRRENVCALALLEDRTICVADVRESATYDFSGSRRYDAMTGYHTQSMLAVPLSGREGEKLGVLQLINAMDMSGQVRPFPAEMVLVLESVASQAAITIQNTRYLKRIRELFHSFVRVMSSAVDERSPYNGNHTRHMAAYGRRFLTYLNAQAKERGETEPFPPKREEEFLMAVWLHDIGKLAIPLEVMDKPARLRPEQRHAIEHRMEVIRLRSENAQLRGRLTSEEAERVSQETRAAEELISSIDTAGFVTDEKLAALQAVSRRTWVDAQGESQPWLTPEETAMLSIRRGTLSAEERRTMEKHVEVTDKLLSQISFSPELSHVHSWASSHHELLNGSGYPQHLANDAIPTEVRMLTILDIFDALTADDRPYKPGMSVERALSVLDEMANREGKLDPTLVRLFTESRCWEAERRAEGGTGVD